MASDVRISFRSSVLLSDGWMGELMTVAVVGERCVVFPTTAALTSRTRVRSRFVRALARIDGVERIQVDSKGVHIGKRPDVYWRDIAPKVEEEVRKRLELPGGQMCQPVD